ncbi:hypothetical protein SBV1_10035 [Verrucomicrobia bacterium]|nr:hypothetical protein SBV1_10035 [Verrucomicrobiota bacterium]
MFSSSPSGFRKAGYSYHLPFVFRLTLNCLTYLRHSLFVLHSVATPVCFTGRKSGLSCRCDLT